MLDKNYCIKVFNDNDFSNLLEDFKILIKELKHDIFINAKSKYEKIVNFIDELKKYNYINDYESKIPSQFNENIPYFDMIDYNNLFDELFPNIKNIVQGQEHKIGMERHREYVNMLNKKHEEQKKIEKEQLELELKEKRLEQERKWREQGLCPRCGGQIGGVFKKNVKDAENNSNKI